MMSPPQTICPTASGGAENVARAILNIRANDDRERVNCLLAHLTVRRLKYKNRSWPDKKMAGIIESLIEEFVKELPRHRRAWFRSVIAKTPQVTEMQPSSQPPVMPSSRRRAA